MRPLENLNTGKPYSQQIKPCNFLLTCHVKALGHPTGADPQKFHLIGPYEPHPRKWVRMEWIDQYTGNHLRIATSGHYGRQKLARVKTYGDILREYEFHAESKCADVNGNTCKKQTVGLLQSRHVEIARLKYIGKESNKLEDVDVGVIHTSGDVYTEYPDPRRDEWETRTRPALKKAPLEWLVRETGMSRRALMKARAAHTRPHPKNQQRLAAILKKLKPV